MTITKHFRILQFILLLICSGFLYKVIYQKSNAFYFSEFFIKGTGPDFFNENDILNRGDGIIFLETTDTLQPKPLVLCAIESAARVYHDRPVVFFMKGLKEVDSDGEKRSLKYFPTLKSLDNIYILPLILDDTLNSTPFLPWYNKIIPEQEKYWIHNIADSCRLALMWKFGGIYMDTDIISIRPVPYQNFVAAEYPQSSSNGVFGFSPRHNFTWKCMERFVQDYNGEIWGHQGPYLFTHVLKQSCDLPVFKDLEDINCGNISFLNPQRFYPIAYGVWRQYYEVWDKLPTFNDSYAVHLWNYMNHKEHRTMVPGSNTLVEHLYKKHCPSTYGAIQRNESIYL
ncbi:alpha-1,4-N-acetylglucosaminyltransferase-like [Rhinoderma darwinii]|uniref:alpha-1,4-N-acetylglucosaminyltransferase-like n=1 Tax=Rhinoderma darwinii TaxID=43563 RepID=UPI003F67C429